MICVLKCSDLINPPEGYPFLLCLKNRCGGLVERLRCLRRRSSGKILVKCGDVIEYPGNSVGAGWIQWRHWLDVGIGYSVGTDGARPVRNNGRAVVRGSDFVRRIYLGAVAFDTDRCGGLCGVGTVTF